MGPTVTNADVEGAIAAEHYFTAADGVSGSDEGAVMSSDNWQELGLVTFCVLVLKNGFKVTGESCCVSPENFDKMIGQAVARKNAVEKVWMLLGYELKSALK